MKKLISILIIISLLEVLTVSSKHLSDMMHETDKAKMPVSIAGIADGEPSNVVISIVNELEMSKEENWLQTYWDFYELPFEELKLINEEGFEDLRAAYAGIDFTSEFEKGDLSSYGFYIEKFKPLINNEITFYDTDTNEEYYLNQYGMLKSFEDSQYDRDKYDRDKYTYFFFDIDSDGYPELGVSEYIYETKLYTYIFRYDAETDRIEIWYKTGSVSNRMMGSRKMGGDNGGRYYFFDQLNSNGKLEMQIEFVTDWVFTNGKIIYLVSLPWCKDKEPPLPVTKMMKRQGYYAENQKWFYFRVTEEQYDELTERYFIEKEKAENSLKEVSYTYTELFGNEE
ncbi:MAG: hypothetical protein NC392_11185 [Roseburia sp.]|nr:hypothetical protein [Roseburia sp.]